MTNNETQIQALNFYCDHLVEKLDAARDALNHLMQDNKTTTKTTAGEINAGTLNSQNTPKKVIKRRKRRTSKEMAQSNNAENANKPSALHS